MSELIVSKMIIEGHHIEVMPPQTGNSSALFYCRDCRTGFHKAAVRGKYSSPQPCKVLENIWNQIRPLWKQRIDRLLDKYYVLRLRLKIALWRLGHE